MESNGSTTSMVETVPMCYAVRYNGEWYTITPKSYEPERQTFEVAWRMIKGESTQDAYRNWFAAERENAKIFYPSFRKDDT